MDALPHYDRALTTSQLRGAVARLALRPDIWSPLVPRRRGKRRVHEIVNDGQLSAYLVCWARGDDSEFQEHPGAPGAVVVVEGALLDQRLSGYGDTVGTLRGRGEVFDVGAGAPYRLRHYGRQPATTLHVHSPSFTTAAAGASVAAEELRRLGP